MILVSLLFNTILVRYLPKIEGLVLIIHIAGFFGVLIPLVYLAPHGKASDVFGTFSNGGGWDTQGLAFFVGIVTGVYAFLGKFFLIVHGLWYWIQADDFCVQQGPIVLAIWVYTLLVATIPKGIIFMAIR